MLIRVTAREEPYPPVTAAFRFNDDSLTVAARMIKERLAQNLRINLNDAMLLFAVQAASLVISRAGPDDIRRKLSGMISYEQMMPGTPEMMRRLDLEIHGDGTNLVTIDEPVLRRAGAGENVH